MQGFAAVLAEAALARAISDTADPDEKTAAQRLVADLLVSCPEDDRHELAYQLPLTAFLSDAEYRHPVHASAVARAVLAPVETASTAHQQSAGRVSDPARSGTVRHRTVCFVGLSIRSGVASLTAPTCWGWCSPTSKHWCFRQRCAGGFGCERRDPASGCVVQTVSRLLNLCGRDTFLVHHAKPDAVCVAGTS